MESAFVAGATGYVGRHVVLELCRCGLETVAHVRPDSPRLEHWRGLFKRQGATVDCTPWSERPMEATMKRLEPGMVFALLGTTRKRVRADAERGVDSSYQAVDYGLTSILLHACKGAAHKPRFVYLSSLGAGPRSRNTYLKVRWRVEQELESSGLPYTIARPAIITGKDREEMRPAEIFGACLGDSLLGLARGLGGNNLSRRYRSTDATTLARALVKLARDPLAEGRVVLSEDLRP